MLLWLAITLASIDTKEVPQHLFNYHYEHRFVEKLEDRLVREENERLEREEEKRLLEAKYRCPDPIDCNSASYFLGGLIIGVWVTSFYYDR